MSALLLAALVGFAAPARAVDEVVFIPGPESTSDLRYEYTKALLTKILEKTEGKYGRASVSYSAPMVRDRMLVELKQGALIQVAELAERPDFNKETLVVKFPTKRDLLGIRLLLINKKDQARFSKIKRLEDLKRMTALLGAQWSITPIFENLGFKVERVSDYNLMFRMIGEGWKGEYFPRGVNEIYDEFDTFHAKYGDLKIEESLAVKLPLMAYFYVTPKRPDLAERIGVGLKLMQKDGSFDQLFRQHHGAMLAKADLRKRRIFELDLPTP